MAERTDDFDPKEMSLGEHLEELRWRLIYALIGLAVGVGAALALSPWLLALLRHPYAVVMSEMGREPDLAVLEVAEGFVMYMKVSLIGGLLIASPWVLWQIWGFLAAGLYRNERRLVLLAVPACTVLFLGGATFFLLGVSKPTLRFFLGFATWMGLEPVITFRAHVSFMLKLMLAFGLAFQTPVVIFLLVKMGITTTGSLARYRRHVIVGFLLLSAFLTSPSPLDQVLLALPMWALFELGLLVAWLLVTRPARKGEQT